MPRPVNLYEMAVSELKRARKNNTLFPALKLPNLKVPNFKVPNLRIPNLKIPDINIPNFNLNQIHMNNMNFNIRNQLQKAIKNFSSVIGKYTNGTPEEDISSIIKEHIPPNARQVGPYRLADIDGDSEKELITSYNLNNDYSTFILKKQNGRWVKISDIHEPYQKEINYLGVADLVGEGRKQILIGRKDIEGTNILHGYTLNNGKINKMFSKKYNRIEVVTPFETREISTKKHIAFWNKNDSNTTDIELMNWNGHELEPVIYSRSYFKNSVLPYYAQKLKQMPRNSTNWYHLAHSLYKSEMYKDCSDAIKIGLRMNPKEDTKAKFMELQESLKQSKK